MNLAALSKEQKQKMLLIVVMGAAVVYGLYRFALVPAINTMAESRDSLAELRDNMEKANTAIDGQHKVNKQLQESADRLHEVSAAYIPSVRNPLTWATEIIYDQGRKLGIDIESVTPVSIGAIPWAKDKSVDRVFLPYMVRIITVCSYFDLVDLINSIEAENPYACIRSIIINKGVDDDEGTVNRQRITFEVSWPMWRDAEALKLIHTPRKRKPVSTSKVKATP